MSLLNSLELQTDLAYSPLNLTVNKPLKIKNVSQYELVFKVKSNKKNLISMNPCNGFIKPSESLSIPVKIVQQVPNNVTIKLEVNWSKVTPQMKQKNDIKMTTVNKQDIYKKIFTIARQEQIMTNSANTQSITESKSLFDTSKQSKKTEKQESNITPFEYETKEAEAKKEFAAVKLTQKSINELVQNPSVKLVAEINEKQQKITSTIKKQEVSKPQQLMESSQVYRSLNPRVSVSSSNNLEIVSEEDEEDYDKQLQGIKNQQINEKRAISEIKSKIRKVRQELKSKEVIDPKILLICLVLSYLFGSLLKDWIF